MSRKRPWGVMSDARSRLRRLAGRIGLRLVAQYRPTTDEEREAIRVAAEYRALARMLMDGAAPDSPLTLSRRVVALRASARRELAPLKASRNGHGNGNTPTLAEIRARYPATSP